MPSKTRQPAVYISHGRGPMPVTNHPSHHELIQFLKGFRKNHLTSTPDAIIVVTAYWEGSVAMITSAASPTIYYDYFGFPPETYEIKYPAAGDPELAAKIKDTLAQFDIPADLDAERGFDHDTASSSRSSSCSRMPTSP